MALRAQGRDGFFMYYNTLAANFEVTLQVHTAA
jgi:hypothetical protein